MPQQFDLLKASAITQIQNDLEVAVSASADTATTQAGIATTQAGNAASSAAEANTFATQAELAALAAGAPIVTALANPEPADGTVVLLNVDSRNLIVYEVVSGDWVNRGYLIGPYFKTVPLMLADTTAFPDGTEVQVRGYWYEVDSTATVGFVENASGVKLKVLPGADGFRAMEAFGLVDGGLVENRDAVVSALAVGGAISIGPGRFRLTGANIPLMSGTRIKGTWPRTIFCNLETDTTFPRWRAEGTSDDESDMVTDVSAEGIIFDMAGDGNGGFAMRRTRNISVKNCWRYGPNPGKTGTSLVSFQDGDNIGLELENIRVYSFEGSNTRVLFGSRTKNFKIKSIYLYGGGAEAVDLNGCYDGEIEDLYGENLSDEVLDFGNCARIKSRNIRGRNAKLVQLKTEQTNFVPPWFVQPMGCHDNTFDGMDADLYPESAVFFGQGGASGQSFSNNKFSNFRFISADEGSETAVRLASGDDGPSIGYSFVKGEIVANSGQAIIHGAGTRISDLLLSDLNIKGTVNLVTTSTISPDVRRDHVFKDVSITDGDFVHRAVAGLTIDNLRMKGGTISITDPFDASLANIFSDGASGRGFALTFSNGSGAEAFRAAREREGINIQNVNVRNTNLVTSGRSVEIAVTSGATISGVTIDGLTVTDDQSVPTTGDVLFPASTTDFFTFINSHCGMNIPVAGSNRSRGFRGANSINERNTGGFLSEQRGSITITGSATVSDPVTTSILPISISDIEITPISNTHGVGGWWVEPPEFGNGFRVRCEQAPGSGNTVTFQWFARRPVVS